MAEQGGFRFTVKGIRDFTHADTCVGLGKEWFWAGISFQEFRETHRVFFRYPFGTPQGAAFSPGLSRIVKIAYMSSHEGRPPSSCFSLRKTNERKRMHFTICL